jgi:hypothetical protein
MSEGWGQAKCLLRAATSFTPSLLVLSQHFECYPILHYCCRIHWHDCSEQSQVLRTSGCGRAARVIHHINNTKRASSSSTSPLKPPHSNLTTSSIPLNRQSTIQNVLLRDSPIKDRAAGSCLACRQHGAQAVKARDSSVRHLQQRQHHRRSRTSSHGFASLWTTVARCGPHLQSKGAISAGRLQ